MTEQIHRAFDLFIFTLCICSVIWLVYLRSVYLVCHSTCLSSLCVFVLSFDLFIFALCICSVMTEQIHRAKINSRMTEQIHRAKINKSNDRTNTQNEDKRSVIWLVYLRSVYLFSNLTCLSSLCVFGLSFDLFIFVLCICSVIWLVYLRQNKNT
jgi:hypothetical protein